MMEELPPSEGGTLRSAEDFAGVEAKDAREGRASRLASAPNGTPHAVPGETSTEPTLQDNLLSQALAMGSEHFSVSALCLAARTARSPRSFALKEVRKQLAALGWQPEQLPTGLGGLGTLARLSATRLLEGLTVSAPASEARLCRLLRAFGASVTHADTGMDFCCSPMVSATDLPATAPGHADAPPPAPTIPAAALEVFIFSPFVSTSKTIKAGSELSDEQIAEVLEGYDGYDATAADVRAWSPDEPSGEVYWQDLTLRTHRNVRTGDTINEWNYGLGDNDFGSFHFRCAGSATDCEDEKPTVTSVYFAGNYDGDRTCRRSPAPPWSSHDEDSVAVQAAVHAIFGMPLGGSAFQGKCLAVPGRDETAWLQDWTPKRGGNVRRWRTHLEVLRNGTSCGDDTWLKNVERMMDDGLDEGIDWPALPAAAVLLLAGVLVQ